VIHVLPLEDRKSVPLNTLTQPAC